MDKSELEDPTKYDIREVKNADGKVVKTIHIPIVCGKPIYPKSDPLHLETERTIKFIDKIENRELDEDRPLIYGIDFEVINIEKKEIPLLDIPFSHYVVEYLANKPKETWQKKLFRDWCKIKRWWKNYRCPVKRLVTKIYERINSRKHREDS
jgi:hypothetical protein